MSSGSDESDDDYGWEGETIPCVYSSSGEEEEEEAEMLDDAPSIKQEQRCMVDDNDDGEGTGSSTDEDEEDDKFADDLVAFMQQRAETRKREKEGAKQKLQSLFKDDVVRIETRVCHEAKTIRAAKLYSFEGLRVVTPEGDYLYTEHPEVEREPTSYETTRRVAGEVFGHSGVQFGDHTLTERHITEFEYLVFACLVCNRKGREDRQRVVGANYVLTQVARILCNPQAMNELAMLPVCRTPKQYDASVDAIIDRHRARIEKRKTDKRNSAHTMDTVAYAHAQLGWRAARPEKMAISFKALMGAYYYLGSTGRVHDAPLDLTKQQRAELPAFKNASKMLGRVTPSICKSSCNFILMPTALVDGRYIVKTPCDVLTENAPPLGVMHHVGLGALECTHLRVDVPAPKHYNHTKAIRRAEKKLSKRFYLIFYRIFQDGHYPDYFHSFYREFGAPGYLEHGVATRVHSMCEMQLFWLAYALHECVKHPLFSPITAEVIRRVLRIMAECKANSDYAESERVAAFRKDIAQDFCMRMGETFLQRFLQDRCDYRPEYEGDLRRLMAGSAREVKKSRYSATRTLDQYVALVFVTARAKPFSDEQFFRAVNALVIRLFSKTTSQELHRYYWTQDHLKPTHVLPTLNRAMHLAIRAYFRLSARPMPQMRLFYAPLTSNVVFEPHYLHNKGLKQSTMKSHIRVPFDGTFAMDREITQFLSDIALPVTPVHRELHIDFLRLNAAASERVRIWPSKCRTKHYLCASIDLPANTCLGWLAAHEWLCARPRRLGSAGPNPCVLQGVDKDPFVWESYLGDSDDGRYQVWMQLSTRHYGNHLRHVRRTNKQSNAQFVPAHPGFGAVFSSEDHFSRAGPQHRRYWKLYTKRAVKKDEIISVSCN